MGDIDAVITWVDGADPAHEKEREKYIQAIDSEAVISSGVVDTRFKQANEVKYCIHSIRKYAPWIRNIYLVTDNQVPVWLTKKKREELGVKIIDHREIFRGYTQYLPTFNSRTIESMLWRIPGLSDKYLYFNDDVFLIDRVKKEDFFASGKVYFRGEWISTDNGIFYTAYKDIYRYLYKIKNKGIINKGYKAKIKAALLAGYTDQYFSAPHVPHSMLRHLQVNFYKKHPEVFEKNIQYKFRNENQYLPTILCAHLAFKAGIGRQKQKKDFEYFSIQNKEFKEVERIISELRTTTNKYLCIQSMDQAGDKTLSSVKKYLDEVCVNKFNNDDTYC